MYSFLRLKYLKIITNILKQPPFRVDKRIQRSWQASVIFPHAHREFRIQIHLLWPSWLLRDQVSLTQGHWWSENPMTPMRTLRLKENENSIVMTISLLFKYLVCCNFVKCLANCDNSRLNIGFCGACSIISKLLWLKRASWNLKLNLFSYVNISFTV